MTRDVMGIRIGRRAALAGSVAALASPGVVKAQSDPIKLATLTPLTGAGGSYVVMVDNAGEIAWYSVLSTPSDVRQLTNGDLFYPETSTGGLQEANMLGQVVRC